MTTRYSVRSAKAAARAVVPFVITVPAAIGIGFAAGRLVPALVVAGVLVLLALQAIRRASLLMRVDEAGIMLTFPGRRSPGSSGVEHRFSPWSTVHRVLLDTPGPTAQVVLTAAAPIPAWISGLSMTSTTTRATGAP